jgi:hypothetical protein
MKKIKTSIISFSLIISFSILSFMSITYAQIFEFNPEDYYDITENTPTSNSKDSSSSNSEDLDNENCINNQIESVLSSSSSSNSDTNSNDPYTSNFHFVKKFDKNGNLVDSWDIVGSQDGQFLHAHGIAIDSKDNVYVSDAENCNIQKFDKDPISITFIIY